MIICIDGSSCTGKSTAAKALAKLLGYQYLNTGAMFRGIAYFAKSKRLVEEKDIVAAIKTVTLEFRDVQGQTHLFLNNEDVAEQIGVAEVVSLSSKIASFPMVREKLLQLQRAIASQGNFVVEGRDTGSTVFPDADWKFFLDASMEIKIKRFFKVMSAEEKIKYTSEQARKIIEDIDERDLTRKLSPLTRARDAVFYDNSESPTPEQDAMVMWYYINKKDEMIKNLNNPDLFDKIKKL